MNVEYVLCYIIFCVYTNQYYTRVISVLFVYTFTVCLFSVVFLEWIWNTLLSNQLVGRCTTTVGHGVTVRRGSDNYDPQNIIFMCNQLVKY